MVQLRKTNLTYQIVDDDVIVLDLDGSRYLQVNGTGRVLWEALVSGGTEAEMIDALVERFDIGRDRAEADVTAFIADLQRRGLVQE